MSVPAPIPASPAPVRAPRHERRLRAALLTTALLDELSSGFIVVALPLLRDHLRLSYAQAGLLFTVGGVSSMVLEPIINLLSDRGSKRVPILLGALTLVLSFALAGVAPNYGLELVAFALWYPANGAAVSVAQAALIDHRPHHAERTMTRWTLLSGVGDLLAPLMVGVAIGVGLGWTTLCLIAAALWFVVALFLAPQHFPAAPPAFNVVAADKAEADEGDEAAERVGLLAGLREALRDKLLLRWMGIVLLATMPDEVFLAFAALYLTDHLHTPASLASLALAVGIGGGLLALIALDRLGGRIAGVRLLPWMALVTLVGFITLLAAPDLVVATLGLLLANMGAAGWYPIAKAAAYDTRPGRSGVVQAVDALGQPFDTALPGFVGLLAGHFGLAVGIGFLALSPLGVLLLLPRQKST